MPVKDEWQVQSSGARVPFPVAVAGGVTVGVAVGHAAALLAPFAGAVALGATVGAGVVAIAVQRGTARQASSGENEMWRMAIRLPSDIDVRKLTPEEKLKLQRDDMRRVLELMKELHPPGQVEDPVKSLNWQLECNPPRGVDDDSME